jgi:hypothetical protein
MRRPLFALTGALATFSVLHACSTAATPAGNVQDASISDAPLLVEDAARDAGPPVPANANGRRDGDETDIDCGGTSGKTCVVGQACAAGTDCASASCISGACRSPSASDGAKNGDETDIDCGGAVAARCTTGRHCVVATDCKAKVCEAGTCLPPKATDGIRNGDESDVDCGGFSAPACAAGKICSSGADCASFLCDPNFLCTAASLNDGVKNGTETGVDCGGGNGAPLCGAGGGCGAGADCTSGVCLQNRCGEATNNDGVQNGSETDIDCGGQSGKSCGAGKNCAKAADCTDLICTALKCVTGTAADGVKNRDETDVDCGGANAPKCATAKLCGADADCASATCGEAGLDGKRLCADRPSCRGYYGGRTCGTGEVGEPNTSHEDCCRSYPVPGITRVVNGQNQQAYLNKYEITAGRIRSWVNAITAANNGKPDIRSWVVAHPVSQLSAAQLDMLPSDYWNPADFTYGGNVKNFGLYPNLGPELYATARIAGSSGCYLGTKEARGYGHPNYYWTDPVQVGQLGEAPRILTREQLDVKAMNCMTPVMFAAFCAWDGGEMMSTPAWNAAWGNQVWPWGAAPSGYDSAAKITNYNPGGTSFATNPPFRYAFPFPGDTTQTDQSFAIAAPGRFSGDVASVSRAGLMANATDSWMDMGGNHLEWGAAGNGVFSGWAGNSWEGHAYSGYANHGMAFGLDAGDKYGKGTTRCMYWK